MPSKRPRHVAIIMDGNGRWAQARGHNRLFGHLRGARVAKTIIEHSVDQGLQHLTLFAFSTENWFRPFHEVNFLMRLLRRHLNREMTNLVNNNIRFRCIGDLDRLPLEVRRSVEAAQEATEHNTGMNLAFALSYGGRQEILNAVVEVAEAVKEGSLQPEEVTERYFSGRLQSSFLPDPDLIIRTSGESRISNFFLWQAAYAELYISQKMWPEFTPADLDLAMEFFSHRERRFGRILNALPGGLSAETPSLA